MRSSAERHRRDGDGRFRGGHAPQTDGALLADFGVRRELLAGEHVRARAAVAGCPASGRPINKIEKCLGEFEQSFGALVAVGDHQQRAFGELPQQHQIQRLGGGRKSGERELGIVVAQRLGEDS